MILGKSTLAQFLRFNCGPQNYDLFMSKAIRGQKIGLYLIVLTSLSMVMFRILSLIYFFTFDHMFVVTYRTIPTIVSKSSLRHIFNRSIALNNYPQSLDYTSLHIIKSELKTISPCKIENIIQDDSYNLYLQLKSMNTKTHWLHICWHPKYAFLTLAQSPKSLKTKSSNQLSFEQTLTSFINTMLIVNIGILDSSNRIIYFDISDKISEKPKYRLYHEIIGVYSNLLLVDSTTEEIISCGYQLSAKQVPEPKSQTINRMIQLGYRYAPPERKRTDYLLAHPDLATHLSHNSQPSSSQQSFISLTQLRQYLLASTSGSDGIFTPLRLYNLLLGLSPAMSPNIAYALLHSMSVPIDNIYDTTNTTAATNTPSHTNIELTDTMIAHIHTCLHALYTHILTVDDIDYTHPTVTSLLRPYTYTVSDQKGGQKPLYTLIQFPHMNVDLNPTSTTTTTQSLTLPGVSLLDEPITINHSLSMLTYLRQYYSDTARNFLFSQLHKEAVSMVSRQLEKIDSMIAVFDKQLFDAK